MTFEGASFLVGKKNKPERFGLAWYTRKKEESLHNGAHVQVHVHVARNTKWFSGFNYRKSIGTRTAKLGKCDYRSTSNG
jgi:hypothetical protein